jgi:hypothetical protein
MPPTILKYPLDPTGVSPDNLVQNEPHTMVHRHVRSIAPTYGAFFTESVVIVDTVNNSPLVKDTQYYAAEMYELPTERYGKEICSIIVITDATVSDSVMITYQALGGEFSTPMDAIVQMLNNLALDNRPVSWPNIIERPSQFPPSMHLHDAGDIYGFEYVVHALDRIRAALEAGDEISHDAIYRYIDTAVAAFNTALANAVAPLANNAAVNAALALKVNLSAIADTGSATAGVNDAMWMTPLKTAQAISALATTPTNAALALKVDLSAKADTANADAGTNDTMWMTPLKTAQAIATLIPAATTSVAGKVALGTYSDIATGTDYTKATTPADVKTAINNIASSIANTAVNSIPSATQSNQGLVQLATAAETLAGSITSKATHPAGVVSAINSLISTAITNLVNGSPAALNQLNELAAALGNDPNFATTITNSLAGKAPLSHTHYELVNGGATAVLDSGGTLTATGDIAAYSDIRLKTDLKVITSALEKVKQLTGYTYMRTDLGVEQASIIAQDLQKVQPVSVHQDAESGYLSVVNSGTIALLVEAVKELATIVESRLT